MDSGYGLPIKIQSGYLFYTLGMCGSKQGTKACQHVVELAVSHEPDAKLFCLAQIMRLYQIFNTAWELLTVVRQSHFHDLYCIYV